jgi:thioredoxin 1
MPTEITAPLHFRTLAGSNTYLIVDFYATWCPPCKAIAPIYEQLSKQHETPGKIAFAKVNVDEQREVAAQYGIQAMPTFLVLKNGNVVDTVKGADPPSLKRVVAKAVEEVGKTGGEESRAPEQKETKPDPKEGLSMAERLGIKLG